MNDTGYEVESFRDIQERIRLTKNEQNILKSLFRQASKFPLHQRIFARQFSVYLSESYYGGREEGGWSGEMQSFCRIAQAQDIERRTLKMSPSGEWVAQTTFGYDGNYLTVEKRIAEKQTNRQHYQ